MITLDMIPSPNPAVVSRVIKDEAVLVLPARGQVKVLNEVGARIWSLVDGKRTVGNIIATIEAEYAVSAEVALNDTSIFLDQLANREIIVFSQRVKAART
jgi:hypothetical protein